MRSARVCLASIAVVLTMAAPAGSVTANGLYGTVKRGPTKPVCRVGEACDAPVQVTLRFTRTTAAGTTRLYALRSKASGAYRIALPAGYYTVTTKEKIGIDRNIRPRRVHVRRGHWDKLDFFIDTGIR
jgi:hypothetical protein